MESLMLGDTTLKDIFVGKKPVSERPQAIERSPSGTRKWIKEISSLANVVVGHCARYATLTSQSDPPHLIQYEALDWYWILNTSP